MDSSKYNPDYEYEDYDESPRYRGVTSVGLSPGQLALIIGVNAVISLVISIGVVLLAGRTALPGEVATPATPVTNPTPQTAANANGTPMGEGSQLAATPTNLPGQPTTYQVQSGDTLTLIAEKFGVSLADIMTANGLDNQDFIRAGQELIIPVGGLATPTSTFTLVPLPTDTPLPFDPPTPLPTGAVVPPEPVATIDATPLLSPTASPTSRPPTPTVLPTFTPPPFKEVKVVVSEIIAPGDLFEETLVILNQGAGTSLKDWKLEGSLLGVITFPDIFLYSGSIRIHTVAGENTPSDLYLNQGEAAWAPGTTIILSNANSAEVSRFTVPAVNP
jgi:LysM repeat protein